MSLKKSLRMLAVGIAVAGCVLILQASFGTVDDACAGGHCGHTCPHTTCVTVGCGDDGIMETSACTEAVFQGPHLIECSVGCKNVPCS
jgi:hypothetical protein